MFNRSSKDFTRALLQSGNVERGIMIGSFLGPMIGVCLDKMWCLNDNHNERQMSPYGCDTFDAVSFAFLMGSCIFGVLIGGAVGYAIKNRTRLFSQGNNSEVTVKDRSQACRPE